MSCGRPSWITDEMADRAREAVETAGSIDDHPEADIDAQWYERDIRAHLRDSLGLTSEQAELLWDWADGPRFGDQPEVVDPAADRIAPPAARLAGQAWPRPLTADTVTPAATQPVSSPAPPGPRRAGRRLR